MKKHITLIIIVVILLSFFPLSIFLKGNLYDKGLDEECDTCKATAILWVDYTRGRELPFHAITRKVKVYAEVSPFGKVEVLSYCKKQTMKVESYLKKRLEVFTIRKNVMEQGYVKPGRQYLQLHYVVNWMN